MLAILRPSAVLALALLSVLPFLFTEVPPLSDVPGHMGRFAVQTARDGDPLLHYFGFRWTLTLNLASDLVVHALHQWIDIAAILWTLSALTPALTTLGIMLIARTANPRGATALPWALLYVFSFPFFWGFLNFSFTTALALLAFAAWIALACRRRLRIAMFLAVTPLLLIGHGVAGIVLVGMIAAWEFGEALLRSPGQLFTALRETIVWTWPPLLAAFVTVAAWKLLGTSDSGRTLWLFVRKREALLMMLRDQSAVLDIGSVIACLLVWVAGRLWGARLHGGATGVVLFLILLFLATPSLLSGSDRIDTRLAPLIPMLAFALQDWSAVQPRRRRTVVLAGFALLGIRFAVTTASFVGYDRRYRLELSALDHVPQGARILNLSKVYCDKAAWRSARLEHLANLATLRKGAWVNTHWSIAGLQLLQVRYVPSPEYARDPSHLVWPPRCVLLDYPFAQRDRHMLVESMAHLPLDRVDYLWLIGERLPPDARPAGLRLVWHDDISELYATARSTS